MQVHVLGLNQLTTRHRTLESLTDQIVHPQAIVVRNRVQQSRKVHTRLQVHLGKRILLAHQVIHQRIQVA